MGRLIVMKAAWKLDQGDFARQEVSMAKIHVADTLHKAVDTAIQLNGARGYSKDTVLEWIYRYARQARLVDGASEVHKMVLARFIAATAPISGAGALNRRTPRDMEAKMFDPTQMPVLTRIADALERLARRRRWPVTNAADGFV